jgi:hypothetical protein
MLASDKPLTVSAHKVDPYLHLDNRGLIFFDGIHCVMFPAATMGWVAETFQILRDEKRATRRQGDHILGGFIDEEGARATLYAGSTGSLATMSVEVEALTLITGQLGR